MKTILAAILGGVVLFAWGAVSWMVLDWHEPTIKVFANEDQVSQVLTDNAPVSGIYVLPKLQSARSETHPEVTEQLNQEAAERLRQGPFAFVALTPEGMAAGMTRELLYTLGLNIVMALLVVWLVKATEGLGYLQRVVFITTIGIVIAGAGRLPNWIWWKFATDYMIVEVADVIIGWFAAAIVVAALTGEDRHRFGLTYRRMRL